MTEAKKLRNHKARVAVGQIIADLSDRRGLSQEWEQIDRKTQAAIRRAWREIIAKCFSAEET